MFVFFFFKQKTAYEMRISDWSSDVCSSDLLAAVWWHCTAGVHRPASRLFRTYTVCRDVEAAAAVILFLSSGERAANYRTLPRRTRFTMASRTTAPRNDAIKAERLKSPRLIVPPLKDRKSVVEGKSVSVRVDLGGCRSIKKKKK